MAESLAEGADDELLKNKIYERLYIVNYVNENRRLALVYAKRFLESSLTFDDAELITRGCSGVASCFYLLGHADSTAVYLNKCVPYIDRLAPKLQASLWSYLAAVAYENRDVEQAERLLKKSFSIEEQPYANYIQGLMEFAAGNDDAARQCMEKALETDDEKLRGIIYERLAYYYNKNNIMGEAYDNILKKLDQLESAHDDGKQKNIIEQQLLLDLEHSAKKQHSRMLYLCLGGFAILSLLIVCIIFYRRKVGACRAEIESKKNDMLSYEADNTLYKVELDKYKKELEDSNMKISALEQKDQKSRVKIASLIDESNAIPGRIIDELGIGGVIYGMIERGENISQYTDNDMRKLIDVFSIIDGNTFSEWQKSYNPLTVRQYLHLILYKFRYTDSKIADMLGISESSVRSTRSRIKKNKK